MTSTTEYKPHLFTKILYWVSTGIVLFLLTWAAASYHIIHDTQAGYFTAFGYPTYLVYPLAYLKIAAILIIVTHRYSDLRDMAYAAYFINMAMALVGHIIYGDFSFCHLFTKSFTQGNLASFTCSIIRLSC